METHAKERISKLPAPVLQHILSFLSQDEAARSCVLSKPWRYLWSTRPKFTLEEHCFRKDKEKFMFVLDKSLQVYFDHKLRIEEFSLYMSKVDPELVLLLEKWIPRVIHDFGVKKFDLSFSSRKSAYFDLPSAVFESESLQELNLQRCKLSQKINSFNGKHLKKLYFTNVYIEEENFDKITLSSPLIEDLCLYECVGFRTIKMHNHRYLKDFDFLSLFGRNEIYLPSGVGHISIYGCLNWYHLNHNYFPSLKFLCLNSVPLSNEWFVCFSRNFPCVEELQLLTCDGFDECRLSSRSIKKLDIWMNSGSTVKATIVDAPSIKMFKYHANISQSLSFTTTSREWKSKIMLSLDLDASLWFLRISELVAALSQSQISLSLSNFWMGNYQHIEHLSDISVPYGSYNKRPVAIESLELSLQGHYYDSFFSDLVNGLFRIFRPREIKQSWNAREENQNKGNEVNAKEKHHSVELMCKILQMGKSDDQEMNFWQQDLEEVSLQVYDNEWHPVEGTISWSEHVAALLPWEFLPYEYICSYELRFQLKWREQAKCFDL